MIGIPCFNEEQHISQIVSKCLQFTDFVLVVDDGSTDDTPLVARNAGALVIQHPRNSGVGAARKTAMRLALSRNCALITLDGDGQHDPDDLPRFARLITSGLDIVVGSRFLGHGGKPPIYRQLGQRFLTLATNICSGCPLTDSQSGYRAFSIRALERITPDIHSSGFAFESEIQFLAHKHDLRVAEIPISCRYLRKSKRNPFGHGLHVSANIAKLTVQTRIFS